MSSEFLSQDEVDALLKGVNGDEDASGPSEQEAGVRPYNLAKQERIVRGRMPTLEILNERFARYLRIGLFNFMRKSPEISVGPIKVCKYSEFVRNLVVPTNLNIVHAKPLRGSALVVFEPTLVFTVVDNLFGGDSRFHTRIEGRDFTLTEQRIIQRMLEVVLEGYTRAWKPVHPISFEYVRSEMHTQFANIATPSEIVVTTSFSVELGSAGGDIHICIPYSTLEPIRDVLYSSTQADNSEPDTRWMRMLTKQVQFAEVDLIAQLARTQITLGEILNMRAGDIIDLDLKPTLTAEVDGVPVFECRYGVLNGQYSIKIDQILSIPPQENSLGDEHV
ncbi:MAG TPA: flagellar motor switch protein FliM [Burkholderiales bacterium]|nr:flagellar motor switch protein FliM [Burkholderiales bacterium]